MKRRIKRLEAEFVTTGGGDDSGMISAERQFDFLWRVHRIYGRPGTPPPRLENYSPRPRAEWDAKLHAALARTYGS